MINIKDPVNDGKEVTAETQIDPEKAGAKKKEAAAMGALFEEEGREEIEAQEKLDELLKGADESLEKGLEMAREGDNMIINRAMMSGNATAEDEEERAGVNRAADGLSYFVRFAHSVETACGKLSEKTKYKELLKATEELMKEITEWQESMGKKTNAKRANEAYEIATRYCAILDTAISDLLNNKEDGIEKKEKPEMKDIQYVHIDDHDELRDGTAKELKERFGMEKKLGEATSAEEGIELIQRLAEEGNAPQIIILDQQFFLNKGEDMPMREASKKFVKGFKKLLDQENLAKPLKDTKIIMYSGTADMKYIEELRSIVGSDRILGLMRKGEDGAAEAMAGILANAGIIKINDEIQGLQKKFNYKEATSELISALEENGYHIRTLRRDRGDTESRLFLLEAINKARAKANAAPLDDKSTIFEEIIEIIVKTEPYYQQLYSSNKLLLQE